MEYQFSCKEKYAANKQARNRIRCRLFPDWYYEQRLKRDEFISRMNRLFLLEESNLI